MNIAASYFVSDFCIKLQKLVRTVWELYPAKKLALNQLHKVFNNTSIVIFQWKKYDYFVYTYHYPVNQLLQEDPLVNEVHPKGIH